MANSKINTEKSPKTRRPPATTPEARENQLISLTVDLAEKQLREGTASSQVMTHFLKLGSTREKLEQERIAMEVSLMEAKMGLMAQAEKIEELYSEAITAMRRYNGQDTSSDSDSHAD